MTDQQPNPSWGQPPPTPPAGGWGPVPQPPKKKHRGRNISLGVVGAVIVISVIAAATGGGGKKSDGKPAAAAPAAATQPAATPAPTKAAAPAPKKATAKPKPKAPDTVEYVVTGSPAEVTYGPAGSSLSGHSPMTVTKKLGSPAYYSVTAQLSGSGTVKCEIKVKGKILSHATATGSYNLATCEIVQDPLGDDWVDANSY